MRYVLFLLLCVSFVYSGEELTIQEQIWVSDENLTVGELFSLFKNGVNEAKESGADVTSGQVIGEEVDSKNAGSDNFADDRVATIKDYLPLYRLLFADGSVSDPKTSEDGKTVTVQYNPFEESEDFSLMFELSFQEPSVYSPLKESIDEAQRAARVSLFEDSLKNSDDVTYGVSWNLENNKYGRKVSKGNAAYLTDIVNQKTWDAPDIQPFLRDVSSSLISGEVMSDSPTNVPLWKLKKEFKTKIVEALKPAAVAARNNLLEIQEVAEYFPALLANQPQFNITAKYREPDKVVGQRERSITVRYEHGFANLNKFRKDNPNPTWKKLKGYINKNKASLRQGNRIMFALEYTDFSVYDLMLPASKDGGLDPVNFHIDGDDRFKGTFAWGRSLSLTNEEDRIDVSAEYEKYKDEEAKRNRAVFAITYTKKVTDTTVVPLSIKYANHAEYLGEVDRELSLHFGLNWKGNKDK